MYPAFKEPRPGRTLVKPLVIALCASTLVVAVAFGATVSITFESSEEPRAVLGAEATNLYIARGVRFPSRPTIEASFGGGRVLQQPWITRGPLSEAEVCAPLVMEFSAAMGVREVRMNVLNRHVRYFSIQAFAGSTEVDVVEFHPIGNRYQPQVGLSDFTRGREYTLRADVSEGDITRVVANPPSSCFDLMVIDNLVIETAQQVAPIDPVAPLPQPNRVFVEAYEISQGVMSRLTWPNGPAHSVPDTRLMALTGKTLTFVQGRDTAVRFFLGASEIAEPDFDATLSVTVLDQDGSTRRKSITENTAGGCAVPLVSAGDADARRRAVLRRRARVDQSLDYVIPGRFLQNARWMRLELLTIPTGSTMANIVVDLVGPYRMGLNVERVNGVGLDAVVGPAPSRVATSLVVQYLQDLYPVTGRIVLRESGVLTMNSGLTVDCGAFLHDLDDAIAGTSAAAPIPGVEYWTNLYIAQNPPGCGGLGWYNKPGALTNTSFSTAAHEVGHNIGINHATNQHGESADGANDWEAWPYTHGSIGAVDEAKNYDDGVFGVVLTPAPASVGLDMVENWGTWTLSVIAPCLTADVARLFPNCTAGDAEVTHDYMSYGPATPIPVWGAQKWISDVNYHRALQWFERCICLDPPHRFQTGSTDSFIDATGECNGSGSGTAGAAPAAGGAPTPGAGESPQDALVFSGLITEANTIESFRTLRKLATPQSFRPTPGRWVLRMRTTDGSILRSISFAERVAPSEGGTSRAFTVVARNDPQLARVDIDLDHRTVFTRRATGPRPSITLLSPKGGEVWKDGTIRIAWDLRGAERVTDVYLQYSPDAGASWLPLGIVRADQRSLDVEVADLNPSNEALLYLSAAQGINTDAVMTQRPFAVGPNAIAPALNEDCLELDRSALEVRSIGGSWKIVEGDHWLFDFGSQRKEARAAYAVIKRFGFDATCWVGRPAPSMTYLKKAGRVPGGSSAGLDCIPFDRSDMGMRRQGEKWLLHSGRSRMALFPNEEEARQALAVIKTYALGRHCFVGRPHPSFEFWLSDR